MIMVHELSLRGVVHELVNNCLNSLQFLISSWWVHELVMNLSRIKQFLKYPWRGSRANYNEVVIYEQMSLTVNKVSTKLMTKRVYFCIKNIKCNIQSVLYNNIYMVYDNVQFRSDPTWESNLLVCVWYLK